MKTRRIVVFNFLFVCVLLVAGLTCKRSEAIKQTNALELSKSNNISLNMEIIPEIINSEEGTVKKYNLTVSSDVSTPTISLSLADSSVATVMLVGTSLNFSFLKVGTTTLVITVNSPQVVKQEDTNGDGVLDKVTYPAVSKVFTRTIRVVSASIGKGALNVNKTNAVSVNISSVSQFIDENKGEVKDYILSASSDVGTPKLTASTADSDVAVAVLAGTKLKLSFLKIGSTTLRVGVSIPQVVKQEDTNGDGVLDKVTYPAVSKTFTWTVRVSEAATAKVALTVNKTNTLSLNISTIPTSVEGTQGEDKEYDLSVSSDVGTPNLKVSVADSNMAAVTLNGTKLKISFLKSGSTKLLISANVGKIERKEDVNGDGVADNVTYPAVSKSLERNLTVLGSGGNGAMQFTVNVFDTAVSDRYGHEAIFFNNYFWILGGDRLLKNMVNDIWRSSDGLNWTRVTEHSPWAGRRYFNLFVFQNKLWIIGGESNSDANGDAYPVGTDNKLVWRGDIWSSDNGTDWIKLTDYGPWSTRLGAAAGVFNNKIYLIGGQSETNWYVYQDIYESSDGKNWKNVGEISDATIGVNESREGLWQHDLIVFQNKFLVLGGQRASSFRLLDRVLESNDGRNWKVLGAPYWKDSTQTSSAGYIRPFVFKNKLWAIFGNELLYSEDGITWHKQMDLPLINGFRLTAPRALVKGDSIYIYGSYNNIFGKRDDKVHLIKLDLQ